MSKDFTFIIDTEQYSGNFERELCAYVTGQIGECSVGDKAAAAYVKETKCEPLDFVIQRPTGDNPCMRPCEIYPTPGWFNNGNGGHFQDGQEEAALVDYRNRALDESVQAIERIKDNPCYTQEAKYREIKEIEKGIAKANKMKEVSKWPAYLSVAIFLEREPTPKEIEFMKNRAGKYNAYRAKAENTWDRDPITITGFRLVTGQRKTTEKTI